ncbi:MAG TPA: DUF92 domain-containing protein [Bacillus sp. (in: firmicutes)]|nr:DUF92 domain-containing protein [Bacillus sp. (in: firmicutes)]
MVESLFIYIGITVLSLLAIWWKALSVSGAVGATLVGGAVYTGFGINGLLLLGLFFGTSTVWSKFKKDKKKLLEDKLEKNNERDFIQVIVNGGVAALMALLFAVTESSLFELLFIISLAAANSDTWASEVGTLSKGNPYLLTNFQQVDRGTSGAVSLLGTLAAVFGSLLIVLAAYFLSFSLEGIDVMLLTLFGFIGNVTDTVLGALIQITYKCPQCGIETERRRHCHTATVPIQGVKFVNNDVVNGFSNLIAVFFGALWYGWI